MSRSAIAAAFYFGASLLAIGGCSGVPDEAPDYELAPSAPNAPGPGSGASAPSGSTSTQESEAVEGRPETPQKTKTFRGLLAKTSTVPFGGPPWCRYEMKLEGVEIEVTKLETGEITAARVKDTVVERSIGCSAPGSPPNAQEFTLKSATPTTNGVRLELEGAKTNKPATSLGVELTPMGDGYQATASWKRLDQPAPLDWAVTARLPLAYP